MEIQLPEIRIKYNRLIDPIFVFYCQNNPELKKLGWNDWVPPPKEEIIQQVKRYKEEWVKYEEKILRGLIQTTGLDFKNQIINVHIVSGNPRQISNPLIIKSGFLPSEFVDVLTHELIHKLFSNNSDKFSWSILTEMFPEESRTAKNHIFTHAVLKYIYLDILKDKPRLDKNIIRSNNSTDDGYSKAWKIVEKRGYNELIKELKSKYKMPHL